MIEEKMRMVIIDSETDEKQGVLNTDASEDLKIMLMTSGYELYPEIDYDRIGLYECRRYWDVIS